jgi:hypothetical protein
MYIPAHFAASDAAVEELLARLASPGQKMP